MTIKRKDGSIYKLQGPNPIMSNQSLWEEDDSILHNFNITEVVTKELEDIETEEIVVQIKETIDPPKNKQVISKEIPRNLIYCLPAQIKESYDPLYDETRSSVVYGNKFTLEVIFLSKNDLSISAWNNSINLSKNSIIYDPADKRWWKVTEVLEQNGGYTSICSPSGLQPSFD